MRLSKLALATALAFAVASPAAPPDPVVAVEERARLAFDKMRMGDALLKLEDLKGACQAYRETIALLPSWWMPRLALVRCGRFIGVPLSELIEHAELAVKARPQVPLTHLQYGLVLEDAGRHDDAVRAYRAALRVHADLFEARYRLGILLADMGRHREARRHLEGVLDARPDYIAARSHLAPLVERLGDLPAAEASYRELVRISRFPARALSGLIRFYERHDMTDQAREARREYRSRFPSRSP